MVSKISDLLRDMFGPEGKLAAAMENYEYREGQLEMAELVAEAIESNRHLIVEAGTGTGKSLAYLLPALLAKKQAVVSTLTKNLQEQLYHVDIPFIQEKLGLAFKAATLKGRSNYLCLRRFNRFAQQPYFDFREEAQYFSQLNAWAAITKTGDRSEITDLPDQFSTWSAISSTTESCIGKKCKQRQDCFFEVAKAEARKADIIIINHHLFFADLAMKKRTKYAGVLPPVDLLILDEAHEIEDVGTSYFGLRFSSWQLNLLIRDTKRTISDEELVKDEIAIITDLQNLQDAAKFFFSCFNSRYNTTVRISKKTWTTEMNSAFEQLMTAYTLVKDEIAKVKPKTDDVSSLLNRWTSIQNDAKEIAALDQDDRVYWYEQTERTTTLACAPIELMDDFRTEMFQKIPSVIMTSATLSTQESFTFFKQRIGLDDCMEKVVPSPFDYKKQAILFVPYGAPDPRDPAFGDFIIHAVGKIVRMTEGKAFVLFTSRKRMTETYAALKDVLPMTTMMQGEKPRHVLIDDFKQDINSVLFATSSFWHGVDVVGRSLSVVIIDKIPFSVPDEPVVEARIEMIENRGGNSFFEFMVPSAIITLKQGIGRLIRSRQDFGIMAILDKRIVESRYGYLFQKSLPPVRITKKAAVLEKMAEAIKKNMQLQEKDE